MSAADFRHRVFWAQFDERHPLEKARRARRGPWFWQRGLPAFEAVITMYVAPGQDVVGVFFGRNERLGAIQVGRRLEPHRPALEKRLKLRPGQGVEGLGLNAAWRVNCYAEDNWPAMADWLVTEADRFERALAEVLSGGRSQL